MPLSLAGRAASLRSGTDDTWGHLQLAPRRYYQRLAVANAVVANVLLLARNRPARGLGRIQPVTA